MSVVRITLEGIRLFGRHGCETFEAEHGGNFELILSIEYPEPIDGKRDSHAGRPDYARIHRRAVEVFTKERYQFLEPLAARIAEEILRAEPVVSAMHVGLRKLRPPVGGPLDAVLVEVTRRRG